MPQELLYTISVRVSEQTKRWLDKQAKAQYRNPSEIIRMIVEAKRKRDEAAAGRAATKG